MTHPTSVDAVFQHWASAERKGGTIPPDATDALWTKFVEECLPIPANARECFGMNYHEELQAVHDAILEELHLALDAAEKSTPLHAKFEAFDRNPKAVKVAMKYFQHKAPHLYPEKWKSR